MLIEMNVAVTLMNKIVRWQQHTAEIHQLHRVFLECNLWCVLVQPLDEFRRPQHKTSKLDVIDGGRPFALKHHCLIAGLVPNAQAPGICFRLRLKRRSGFLAPDANYAALALVDEMEPVRLVIIDVLARANLERPAVLSEVGVG